MFLKMFLESIFCRNTSESWKSIWSANFKNKSGFSHFKNTFKQILSLLSYIDKEIGVPLKEVAIFAQKEGSSHVLTLHLVLFLFQIYYPKLQLLKDRT